MTEAEWLAAAHMCGMLSDPANLEMLPLSERKLRLLVCAKCRRVGSERHFRDHQRIAFAEAYADGLATRGQLLAGRSVNPGDQTNTFEEFIWAATYPSEGQTSWYGSKVILAVDYFKSLLSRSLLAFDAAIIRDIFGNPFRPVAFSPSWRTSTAVALALHMYQSRDFSAMPILADALQDAGCDNAEILDHCRCSGPHVRGCWVVDLVLAKE
jgi:hypothetical protein